MSRTNKHAYTKSKRFDVTCRNHGSCSYCRDNRLYSSKHREHISDIDDPSDNEIVDDIEIDLEVSKFYAEDR
jgi:5-methylcytosine-specific restriction endonuclease McrA